MGAVIPKLRASAKGQRCCFEIPGVCNRDPETTCLAHLPSEVKGTATKSDDFFAVFACSSCHRCFDDHWMPREDELFYSLRAYQRTIKFWIENGYLVIPGVLTKQPKPSTKILPRKPMTVQP